MKLNNSSTFAAFILSAIALLIALILFVFERQSRSASNQGVKISILASEVNNDETVEHEDSSSSIAIDATLIHELEQLVLIKKVDFKQLMNAASIKNYSAENKYEVLSQVAIGLVRKKHYQDAQNLIQALPPSYLKYENLGFYNALSLSKTNDFKGALAAYKNQLSLYPYHQASAINYGVLLYNDKQYNKAIEALKHAKDITSGKRKAKSLRFLGQSFSKQKQYKLAESSFKKAIEFEPDSAKSWELLANAIRFQDGDSKEIIANMQKSISLNPKAYSTILTLANYQFSQLNFEDANKLYSDASKVGRKHFEIQLMQAVTLITTGYPYSAKKLLKKQKGISARERVIANNLTALIKQDKNPSKNFAELVISLKKQPELYSYIKSLFPRSSKKKSIDKDFMISKRNIFYWPEKLAKAKNLYKKKQYQQALQLSDNIIKQHSQSSEALLLHSRILLRSNMSEQAFGYIEAAYKVRPESRRISIEYIKQLMTMQRYQQALLVSQKLTELNPRYQTALEHRAVLEEKTGDLAAAKITLENLISLDVDNVAAHYQLALIQHSTQEYSDSIETVDSLLLIDSSNIDARLLRSQSLLKSDKLAESLVDIEKVLMLNPKNLQALQYKKKLQATLRQNDPEKP